MGNYQTTPNNISQSNSTPNSTSRPITNSLHNSTSNIISSSTTNTNINKTNYIQVKPTSTSSTSVPNINMFYDEKDRLNQGEAINTYYRFNTVNHIPPPPKNINNIMNVNSRNIAVENNYEEIFSRESNVLRQAWNIKQTPQINNSNIPNPTMINYNIDPEQLSSNKKSIPKQELDNISKSLDSIYRKYKGIKSNERILLCSKKIVLGDIDPLFILEKQPNLNLTELEQTYTKLRTIYHPDKGGNTETFIKIQNAINICKSIKCGSIVDKNYNELKSGFQIFSKDNEIQYQDRNNDYGKFSLEKFNKAYEQNRYRDDLEEDGYGRYMVESSKDRDDINIENKIGKFKLDSFNNKFNNQKKNEQSDRINEIIKYQVPESLDASDSIGHVLLGSKQETYTSSINSKVNYTDYMNAYTKDNTIAVAEDKSKINKNYKKALKEYKNAKLELTEEQQIAIEEFNKKKEDEELRRVDRFKRMELDYNNYEKKMSNFMLK